MADLLPCPFCGGPAVSWYDNIDLVVCCGKGQTLGDETCAGKYCKVEPDAWNTRTPNNKPVDATLSVEERGELAKTLQFINYITKNHQSCIKDFPNNSGYERQVVEHLGVCRNLLEPLIFGPPQPTKEKENG